MGVIWVKMGQNGVKLGSKWVKRLAIQLTHPPKWVKMGRNRAAMAKIA